MVQAVFCMLERMFSIFRIVDGCIGLVSGKTAFFNVIRSM